MLTLALILTLGCSTEEIAEEAPPPTWNADILPLVEEHCVACHVDGGVAPMALDTYEALEATSPSGDRPVWDTLLPYIDAQIMPPSGAMAECIAYAGDHADVVDEGERTLLVQWIDAGRPRGDGPEVHYTPPASPADDLPAPDHLVRRPEAYTPQFNGSGNDYACFMIPSGFDETKWISKITPAIDNKRIVHHMLLFRAEDNGSEWCRGEEMTSDLIAGWAPGQDGWFLPEGVAFRMDPGDVFALQIHYDATQEDGKGDQSGMNLYFTDTAEHEAGVLWTGSVSGGADDPGGLGFKIPANDPAYQVEGSCTITPLMGEISIFGAWPHMHLLGNHMAATTHTPGREECLVDVRFSFDDQRGYQFDEPVVLQPGDRIDTMCQFDNSAFNPNNPNDPPRDVYLGEGTGDEMCLNFLMYWPASGAQYCLF